MEKSKFGVCPLFTFEKIISGKWMLPVLRCLEQNDGIRFGALLRCFPEITKATLTKQLRRLVLCSGKRRRATRAMLRID